MRHLLIIPALIACMAGGAFPAELTLKNTPVQVYFSPYGGAQEAIVLALGQARSTILVQAYTFTSTAVAQALRKARQRGVRVEALLDASQLDEKYTGAAYLLHAGIGVFIDADHAIAHNKVMVIDDATVITGSFNFTKAAETKNAENLLVIHDAGLAKLYRENWQAHREHSTPYDGPGSSPGAKSTSGTFDTLWRNVFGKK